MTHVVNPADTLILPTEQSGARYNKVAVILHWVMALAFFLMLASGFAMEYLELPKSLKFNMFQWHKSLGVLLLIAFFLRLGWRLWHKPPVLTGFPYWETLLSKLGHWGLYACMLIMPLSGWAMVSASVYGLPTIVFGLFEWPHIPNISGNETVQGAARFAHFIFALGFTALILGHIAAVFKHSLIDKHPILYRMLWTKK